MSHLLRVPGVVLILLLSVIGIVSAQDDEQSDVPEGISVGHIQAEVRTTYTTVDGLTDDNVLTVAVTADGSVFAGTASGLCRFDDGRWAKVSNYAGPVKLIAPHENGLLGTTENALYHVIDGTPQYLADLPAAVQNPVNLNSLVGGDSILLGTNQGLYELKDSVFKPSEELHGLLGDERDVRQVAVAADGRRAVAAKTGLFIFETETGWRALSPHHEGRSWAPRDVRGVAFDSEGRLWFASPQGVGRLNEEGWSLYTGYDGLPYDDFTTMAAGEKGVVWFGTSKGAIRFSESGWEYRQAPRWLPDDLVRNVAVISAGHAWFATELGAGVIERRKTTLREKAQFFEDEIDKYHRRTPLGYVLSVQLKEPGDRSEWTQHDSDNDGLWTSMYGAGECFAYAATKDPKAKQRATAAFEAVRFLSQVTQGGTPAARPGCPARTIRPTSGPNPNEEPGYTAEGDLKRQERDPKWKVITPRWPTSADGKWYWKCDTSSDELDGHYFLYALYYDLVAESEAEKQATRDVVAAITDHLIEHDYALVDHDGKPTRWARYGPNALNTGEMLFERGLNSLSVVSYLKTAEYMTGDEKYRRAYESLLNEHGYKANLMEPKMQAGPGTGNQSDDEMAFMCYYNLLNYETDPDLLRIYNLSLYRYWQLERPERNPLFNYIFAASFRGLGRFRRTAPRDALEDSVDTLRRYPLDRIRYAFDNTHRKDVVRMGGGMFGRWNPLGKRRDGKVIPIDERSIEFWNHNPWKLKEGGEGNTLTDGAAFLLPYYMGLYHGFVIEE
jgi:hypothetical protein